MDRHCETSMTAHVVAIIDFELNGRSEKFWKVNAMQQSG